jgi:hypothetical protein
LGSQKKRGENFSVASSEFGEAKYQRKPLLSYLNLLSFAPPKERSKENLSQRIYILLSFSP